MGYSRAGFEVVGVDIKPQKNYPFRFILGDALGLVADPAFMGSWDFDAIHASPPCQAHSWLSRNRGYAERHQDYIPETRRLLRATGLPYVIENVEGAPLIDPVTICGSSLGLDVRRHRLFEMNFAILVPSCVHGWQTPRFRSLDKRQKSLATVVGVHGHMNYGGERELREKAMEIDWMTPQELVEAIPPVYTELIGAQLLQHIQSERAA